MSCNWSARPPHLEVMATAGGTRTRDERVAGHRRRGWGRPTALVGAAAPLVAALLASCASTAGSWSPPPPATPQTVAEQALENRIYLALNADPVYYYRHVSVRVDDGVADLSGYVWSVQALYRARQIAGGIPGVTQVHTNDLQLEREGQNSGFAR